MFPLQVLPDPSPSNQRPRPCLLFPPLLDPEWTVSTERLPVALPVHATGDNISSRRVPEHLSSRSRNAPAPCLPCLSPSKQLSAPPAAAEPTDERRRSLPCSSSLPWLPLPLIHPLSSLYRCSPRHGSHRRPPRRAPPPLDLLSPWSYSSPAQTSQAAVPAAALLRSSLSPSDPTSPNTPASSLPPGRRSAAGDQAAAAPGPCLDLLPVSCFLCFTRTGAPASSALLAASRSRPNAAPCRPYLSTDRAKAHVPITSRL